MKENRENLLNDKINKLMKKMLELLKVNSISLSALQIKNTESIIHEKLQNESNSIEYGINSINKNVLKNEKKYSNIFSDKENILEDYKALLYSASKYYDNAIFNEIIKILKEELQQLEQNKKLMILKDKESIAKEKADNSDDEIAEEIYSLEEDISKSETKVRRTKTLLNNKIKEKERALYLAIESKDKEIQREIKGPKVIKNATRFFMGKLNPAKMIEKNVFSGVKKRIEEFRVESEDIRTKKIKYSEENIISTINDLIQKTEKKLLKI